jgi:DNA adenine methylase
MPTRAARVVPAVQPISTKPQATPFLKWVGGKGKLRHALGALMPKGVELMRHVEPFVGGGALFFARGPERALLADINLDLIRAYEAVRDEPAAVLNHLTRLARGHDQESYYGVRERFNARKQKTQAERAAHFIYLNKTCFNGLYRVNRQGQFNVPMGRYAKPNIADTDTIFAASAALQRADIRHMPFEALLSEARPGDFIYFDPPYEPVSRTANFTAYAQDGFAQADQQRLRDVFRALDKRGAKLMLSNSDVPFIRDLYRGFQIDEVLAPRAVSCDAKGRKEAREVVVRNYR